MNLIIVTCLTCPVFYTFLVLGTFSSRENVVLGTLLYFCKTMPGLEKIDCWFGLSNLVVMLLTNASIALLTLSNRLPLLSLSVHF